MNPRQNGILIAAMICVFIAMLGTTLWYVSRGHENQSAIIAADVKEGWHLEAPPDMTPILGHWMRGMYPVCHYVLMIDGIAYEYGPEPRKVLEPRNPGKWRYLGK